MNLYWAERAMNPSEHYDPITVKDGLGYAHGSVVCCGNFESVNQKRLDDHVKRSLKPPVELPIWC